MSDSWRPLELKIRQKSGEIADYKGDVNGLIPHRSEFVKVIEELEKTTGPLNKKLIDQCLQSWLNLCARTHDRTQDLSNTFKERLA